jgi:TolB protein
MMNRTPPPAGPHASARFGAFLATALVGAWLHAPQPPQQPPAPQQPTEITTTITGEGGLPPRLALPDFIAVTKDKETVETAKTISQVLWDDLNFEREFAFIPRDVYATIPAATSFTDVPFDRWRELNADGLIIGTVEKTGAGFKVDMRLFNARTRQMAFGREYTGSSPRLFAHTMSDEIHQSQRALRGVARTKLTFDSDRDGERMTGTVERRDVKEIYISDYDGENQRRVTVNRTLNITPTWSPDGRSIAYTSYRRGAPNIFISNIFQGTLDEVTKGANVGQNWLPAFSPDGTRICFASTRGGGSAQLYITNRDGSNVRRLTNDRWINTTPTWSPSGNQIAFVSDRTGSPQIYVMNADGAGAPQRISTSEGYADRPSWSPPPYNEIAYTARTGPGNDIKVIDMATRQVRQLTFGEGTNESPTWAANGRHLAFMSTRSGKSQIFVISRTGQNLKQITKVGNNQQPDWSK